MRGLHEGFEKDIQFGVSFFCKAFKYFFLIKKLKGSSKNWGAIQNNWKGLSIIWEDIQLFEGAFKYWEQSQKYEVVIIILNKVQKSKYVCMKFSEHVNFSHFLIHISR